MNFKKLVLLTIAFSSLTACHWIKEHTGIEDQEANYRNAKAEQPLTVPTNLNNSQIGKNTQTPAAAQGKISPEIPLPPGSLAQKVADGETPKTVLNQPLPKEPK